MPPVVCGMWSAGALVLVVPAAPAAAQFVTPTSYPATASDGHVPGGTYNDFDQTRGQRTDGGVGTNDRRATRGHVVTSIAIPPHLERISFDKPRRGRVLRRFR